MPRKATRYYSEEDLRRAVTDDCRGLWREWTGRDFSTTVDPRDFKGRVPNERDREAQEIAADLARALQRVADFVERPLPEIDGGPVVPASLAAGLRSYVETHLPFLLTDAWRARRAPGGVLGPLMILEVWMRLGRPEGRSVRDAVVALLGDPRGLWRGYGFKKPATQREMAVTSILLGEWPQVNLREVSNKGMTSAELIERETAAIRAAASRSRERERQYRANKRER